MTLADGDPNGVYVATERDGGGGSLPQILRYDTSAAGATLTATNEWDLSPDLPRLGANLGLEAIAFVPDDLLVAKGLIDERRARSTTRPTTPITARACSSWASSRPVR